MDLGRRGNRSAIYLLLLLIAIGMALVWYSTVWGAGLISDSFQYTASARSLVKGYGFSLPYGNGELEPMTKYPPLFSILLAGFELAGMTALQAARIVNILLFGINIFLVYLSAYKLIHSWMFSLLAPLLFAVSFVLVEVHSWALSEPLYICLGLTAILLLQRHFEEDRIAWLVGSALVVSMAVLTRYAGVSLVISIALVLLLDRASWTHRLRKLLLFGSIAILPVILWTLRGYLLTRTLNDRTVGYYPLTVKNYVALIDTVYGWLLPSSLVQGQEKILLASTAVALVGLLVWLARSKHEQPAGWIQVQRPEIKIVLLHNLYFILYSLVIVASKTWVDPDIGLSDRILSPMLVSMLILLVVAIWLLWSQFGRARPVVVLLSLGLVLYYAAGTYSTVQAFHESGIGIARRGWHRSDVIQSLRSYPSHTMYTNSNSSLYLWSDRTGYGIPEFEQLKETGTESEVLLVIFHHVPPTGKRLDNLTDGLHLLAEDQVASIYALRP